LGLAQALGSAQEVVMTRTSPELPDHLLTPSEVAALFRVEPTTVTRWAKAGKLASVRTPGGHRRYRQADVHPLLKETAYQARDQDGS
jgi:excisionase family DNA binding protein